jgi:hypothetical protein
MQHARQNSLDGVIASPRERDLLRDMCLHYRPGQDPQSFLHFLDSTFRAPDWGQWIILREALELLKRIDWRRLAAEIAFEPLFALPSLHPSASQPRSFDRVWPLELADTLVAAGFSTTLEARVEQSSERAIDVFAEPGPNIHPGYRPLSRWRIGGGVEVRGIAFECKAIRSENKSRKRLNEVADQLEHSGGGIAAFDVSGSVLACLRNEKHLGPNDFSKKAARHHLRHHEEVARHLRTGRRQALRSVAGILTHCRVLSDPRISCGAGDALYYTEYRQTLSCLPLRDTLNPHALILFFRDMFPARRRLMHIYPRDGNCWTYILDGTGKPVFECGVVFDGQDLRVRTGSAAPGEQSYTFRVTAPDGQLGKELQLIGFQLEIP